VTDVVFIILQNFRILCSN